MDKKEKTKLLLKGAIAEYKKEKYVGKSHSLLNSIVGLKLKLIRLEKNITAEAVVQDNKEMISDVYSLYKVEQGAFQFGKLYALIKYYNVDVNNLFKLTER